MYDLTKALEEVRGELIDLVGNVAIVKRDHGLHPFVVWRVGYNDTPSQAYFVSGNYCETLEEARKDHRLSNQF